ncbi:15374_t:CDS:2, partial [Entrophospora sp. SA101]
MGPSLCLNAEDVPIVPAECINDTFVIKRQEVKGLFGLHSSSPGTSALTKKKSNAA